MNHARRLAEDDWSGVKREEEEGKRDGEEMDIDPGKKLPKRYANQVSSPETLGPDSPTPPAMLSNPTEINVAVKSMRQEKGMGTSEKMLMCVVYAWRKEMAHSAGCLPGTTAGDCEWQAGDRYPILYSKVTSLLQKAPELSVC